MIASLKTVFKNLNLVKSYDKTNPNVFVFSLWEIQVGLNLFWPVYISYSQKAHDVISTSWPRRVLINQCQIITFLILKSDIIENSRIELRGIVLPAPSKQIKVTVIILPFNLVHL